MRNKHASFVQFKYINLYQRIYNKNEKDKRSRVQLNKSTFADQMFR